MKKFLLLILSVLMSLPAVARDFTYEYEGQTLTYTVIDEEAKTCKTRDGKREDSYNLMTHGNNAKGELVIPEKANDGEDDFTVVAIGEIGFTNTTITSVSLPVSVKEIGSYAFKDCYSLTSVSLPEGGVTLIKQCAFSHCDYLPSIAIPASISIIGNNAFEICARLTRAEFASIESLCKIKFESEYSNPLYYAHHLFINGSEVTDVVIPDSFTEIGEYTFYGSSITSVEIPNSVFSIGKESFKNCKSLTSVNIPNSVTEIGFGAFRDCIAMTTVKLPASVTDIEEQAFYGCSALTSIKIPTSMTEIKGNTFSDCLALTSVEIPNSVTKILYGAFYNCRSLTSVTIPSDITTLGGYTFSGCSALKSVYYPAEVPVAPGIMGSGPVFDNTTYNSATLYVKESVIKKCKELYPWKNFANVVPHDFLGIDEVMAEFNMNLPVEIYNLRGVKVGSNIEGLTPGIYIVRQGKTVRKISVK